MIAAARLAASGTTIGAKSVRTMFLTCAVV